MDKLMLEKLVANNMELHFFDVTDSTNACAKKVAEKAANGRDLTPQLFVAREQTAGRGRMGRRFSSRSNGGIYMSLLYFTDKPLCDAVSITTAAASIVAVEIERVTGSDVKIKWVNDIYNEKGKICGILVESVPASRNTVAIIVGIGINIGEENFPEELCGIAASIGNIDGKEESLVSGIAQRLLDHSSAPEDRGYMTEYRKRLMMLGESVNLLNCGEIIDEGTVVGVDDAGGLLFVPTGQDQAVVVRSGEISVRVKR